jgi:hypothetical protein
MKPIGKLDATHAMYPRRRLKRLSEYERRATERALYEITVIQAGGPVPDPHGSQAQKEAWMRQRQARIGAEKEKLSRERQARIGAEREKLGLPHPPREIQQRWIDEGEK